MINKVILVGRLGKDPEVRHFEGDSSVAAFSVATDDSYFDKTKGERIDRTQWINVVLWNSLAGVAEKYLKKGSLVYIEGKLTTRKWEDKDGNDKYTTEVMGRVMKMLSKAEGSNYSNVPSASDAPSVVSKPAEQVIATPAVAATESAPPAAPTEKSADETGDDLPF
jgi:single-strand DNA-binding protein